MELAELTRRTLAWDGAEATLPALLQDCFQTQAQWLQAYQSWLEGHGLPALADAGGLSRAALDRLNVLAFLQDHLLETQGRPLVLTLTRRTLAAFLVRNDEGRAASEQELADVLAETIREFLIPRFAAACHEEAVLPSGDVQEVVDWDRARRWICAAAAELARRRGLLADCFCEERPEDFRFPTVLLAEIIGAINGIPGADDASGS